MEDFTPMTLILKDSLNIFPFPGSSDGKESARHAGDPSLIPGSGRFPGEERNGNPLGMLAWRTPWTEESGGLLSVESDRVGHD